MSWGNVEVINGHRYVFKKADMPKDRQTRIDQAIWSIDGSRVYVNCASCGEIMLVGAEKFRIYPDGYLTDCVVCRHCHAHIWIYLRGWACVEKELKQRYW